MHHRRNQLTVAVVAFVLGILVVVQLRAQAGNSGMAALSAQDLTVLVANLNERNDQLRTEVASLARVRAYAGLDAVTGPGVTITVSGPIDGPGLEGLINELRTAGAEAIAAGPVRFVPGVVVVGAPGQASVDGVFLGGDFDLSAIGASEQLTGSLTRSGGIIAQLAATQPDVVVVVTPMDRLELPATDRDLVPIHGQPRL